jgi:drug/metabolite transporter (DMT)-like permease
LFVLAAISIFIFVFNSDGIKAIRFNSFSGQFQRAGFAFASGFLFLTGVSYLPLADAIAITFAGPLFMTALAGPMLGELIGWRRWAAVGFGFLGVMVMVRPSSEIIQWVAIFPLLASLAGALRDITTRRISAYETSLSIFVFSTISIIFLGLLTIPFGWSTPKFEDFALMGLSGLLVGGAHFILIERFRWAEAALLAPFKYVSMIWAVIFGFIIFNDFPDTWTLTGASFVVFCGLYIAHRENRVSK